MGNAHSHRNKRGGRHNRGAAPRTPTPGASASTSTSTSGMARPTATPANQAPAPAPSNAPAADVTTPRRQSAPGGKSRGEPSLRAPYAPGQRAPRGSRQPAPPIERQPQELELTAATYEEFVVTTRSIEPAEDQGGAPARADGESPAAPPATRADHRPPAHRHNGHNGHNGHGIHDDARGNGYLRERERDELEDESFDGEEREVASMVPRGDVRGDVGPLIDDLKSVFQRDRATASASGGGTRCGICYLHFVLDELEYRDDEGYYVCGRCAQALGAARVPMVRRQKRG